MHACSEVCEDLCDDLDFCTVDYQGDCELSGCLPTPRQQVDCDNGVYCDGPETCDQGIGCQSSFPITCTAPLFCDEAAKACVECTDNINCSDGLYCNGAEICGLDHTCQTGTAISCPVATPLCDEASDACVECITDNDCDNGNYCDGVEICNVNHVCQSGSAICCAATTPFCDEAAEACVECTADADCDNDLYCDGLETCDELDHTCKPGTAISCPDDTPICKEASDECVECTIFLGLPDAIGYEPVYKLNIANTPAFVDTVVPYTYNYSANIGIGTFNRIAYYLELESATYGSQWLWVSMDAFTTYASMTGVPTSASGIWYQEYVSNLNVYSNVQSLCAEGLEGNLEFWPTNYRIASSADVPGASDTSFDFGDSPIDSGSYGSMQLHVASLQTTVFAFNNWNVGVADIGIGNKPDGGHPDWTFAYNANLYSVKTLEVWVKPSALLIV
jgi:hypothetical protein